MGMSLSYLPTGYAVGYVAGEHGVLGVREQPEESVQGARRRDSDIPVESVSVISSRRRAYRVSSGERNSKAGRPDLKSTARHLMAVFVPNAHAYITI